MADIVAAATKLSAHPTNLPKDPRKAEGCLPQSRAFLADLSAHTGGQTKPATGEGKGL